MRYILEQSRKAVWSLRLALLFALLFCLTLGLHHAAKLGTPVAMNLFAVSVGGAALTFFLGLAALIGIWRTGDLGAARAVSALAVSAVVLALPLWSLPELVTLPRLYDISTDTARPPAYDAVARARGEAAQGANPPAYDTTQAAEQVKAYPDLKPESFARSPEETFGAVREAATSLGWTVMADSAPAGSTPGTLEAVDRSFLFGFTDDIAVRVSAEGRGTRVDVRSSARHGQHDLGRNAGRVRQMIGEVRTRIAAIDTQEAVQRTVLANEERAQKAKREKERLAAEAERVERRQRLARATEERRDARRRGDGSAIPYQRASSDPDNQEFRRLLRDRFREASQGEQQRMQMQRRREKAKALRRFWEQLGQF